MMTSTEAFTKRLLPFLCRHDVEDPESWVPLSNILENGAATWHMLDCLEDQGLLERMPKHKDWVRLTKKGVNAVVLMELEE